MLIASVLAFSPVYKYDSDGGLRHRNPIMEKGGKKQKRRKGSRRHEDNGALEERT